MDNKNKELKLDYKLTHTRMGVFQIRNMINEKILVVSGLNLPGIMNRHQFELRAGGHKNEELQSDWNKYGADKFAFEILDELTPRSEPGYDHKADLISLEDMWLENLQPYGERGYNEKKKTREERLKMIADNRVQKDDDELR